MKESEQIPRTPIFDGHSNRDILDTVFFDSNNSEKKLKLSCQVLADYKCQCEKLDRFSQCYMAAEPCLNNRCPAEDNIVENFY